VLHLKDLDCTKIVQNLGISAVFIRPGRNLPDRISNGRSALRLNRSRVQRQLRKARGKANRASWRLTIKDYGSTDVTHMSSTY